MMEVFPSQMQLEPLPPTEMEGELITPFGSHTITLMPLLTAETTIIHLFFEVTSPHPKILTKNTHTPTPKTFIHITPTPKTFIHITPTLVRNETEIHHLTHALSKETQKSNPQPQPVLIQPPKPQPQIHRSIFSLAKSMRNSTPTPTAKGKSESRPTFRQNNAAVLPQAGHSHKAETHLRVEEREGGGNGQSQQDQEQGQQEEKKDTVFKLSAPSDKKKESSAITVGSIENIYVRFMALMARILGQAEAEAHQLYIKIKERTDHVDTLSLLMAKLNTHKKDVDWTKDEEMQKLVDQARSIGVEVPEGKYKWNDEEKRLLKENIQMRKDSMEKITQLERTDMQRYLQEASQCHQARSNVLKLIKEVIDTIIHNMRS